MKAYAIVTDSTADLPLEWMTNERIDAAALSYEMNGNEHSDGYGVGSLALKEFYILLRAGAVSKTSMVNVATFAELFERHLKQGRDILYVGFSAQLSGTFHAGEQAAEILKDKYPLQKIYCLNSKAASCGEGLLVMAAVKARKAGRTLEEVYEWLLKERSRVCHWFTVEDLFHLQRGGRISLVSAALGSAFLVKPILTVDHNGGLQNTGKVRGRKKALKTLVEALDAQIEHDSSEIVVGHCDAIEEAQMLKSMIQERYQNHNIMIWPIGAVIGSHTGPGTLALFFWRRQGGDYASEL